VQAGVHDQLCQRMFGMGIVENQPDDDTNDWPVIGTSLIPLPVRPEP